jgi:hypothetical protein
MYKENEVIKVEYDGDPGERPDSTRTMYYYEYLFKDSAIVRIEKQKYCYCFNNYRWKVISTETVAMSHDEILKLKLRKQN